MAPPRGIHHVTAIAGDAQRTVDFYAGTLGMRLVKRTVNFDDPGTYHLYFGDERGTPGTIVTFFPWPGASRGREGVGQVNLVSLAIPEASLGFWLQRLVTQNVAHEDPATRFGERVIALRDPDGLRLDLVASAGASQRPGCAGGTVPEEHTVRGVHSVTIWTERFAASAALLEGPFAMRRVGTEGNVTRFASAADGDALLDVRDASGFWSGAVAVGSVHHVAWRVPDDDAELALRQTVKEFGLRPTNVLDRNYFHSVYFREPGGTLFEIATDVPGFAIDEPADSLGDTLVLPPWLESRRDEISASLPPIHLPSRDPGSAARARMEAALLGGAAGDAR